jgi:hypothetical protein
VAWTVLGCGMAPATGLPGRYEPDMFGYAVILLMNSRMLHDRAQFGSYVTFSVHDHETGGFLNFLALGPNRFNGPSCRLGRLARRPFSLARGNCEAVGTTGAEGQTATLNRDRGHASNVSASCAIACGFRGNQWSFNPLAVGVTVMSWVRSHLDT